VVFGYAKPVPVAFHRLNNPKRDMVWVALAGPGVNIAMAVATGLIVHAVGQLSSNPFTLWIWYNLWNFIAANVMLAVFNMLPILPLDGGRVLTGLLPGRLAWRYAQLERYGMLVLLLLIFIIPAVADQLGFHTDPLTAVLMPARNAVYQLVMTVTGWA
jgi:Zn-dependent protease